MIYINFNKNFVVKIVKNNLEALLNEKFWLKKKKQFHDVTYKAKNKSMYKSEVLDTLKNIWKYSYKCP